jgi:hypothetical protein
MYYLLNKKHYEMFSDTENVDVTIVMLKEMIRDYVQKIPVIMEYNESIRSDDRLNNTNKAEVIDSILKDFNNMNYVNMRRYQLTDYKINETRSKTHFVKYAFLIASIIGLLGGLKLRTRIIPLDNNYLPISGKMFTGVSMVLILGYITVFILHQKQNQIRRKYNWNKLYWNVKATHQNQNMYSV